MKRLAQTLSKKWWFWLVFIPLFAWGAWYAFLWYDGVTFYEEERGAYANALALQTKQRAEQIALRAQYARDFDGGKTPQETWALFVAALERGDTDQAAKYYVVEKQEEERENWEAVKKRGTIDLYLGDFDLIAGGSMYQDGNTFEFYTDDIDGGPGFVYVLVKNPITGVWKIEDL